MGWFSDIFSPEVLVPIAAGMAFGPGGMMLAGKGTALTAAAAGAAAGGGLAALQGEDVASGAIGGGLGGLSGGNIYSAFNPTSAAIDASKTAATEAVNAGKTGITAIKPALSQGFSGAGFKEGLQNLGGGGKYSTAIGAGKLASTGIMGAGIGGIGDVPIQENLTPNAYKYDPNRRLNLSGDSGLRLIANGGYIGKRNYADGGYLEGGGVPTVMEGSETEIMSTERDGMSDSIAATIDETQPAALSEGEFVVPADVVSFAGNGSSEAGARKFYKMLGDIREASTGQREQIKEIDVEDYMPMSDGIGALA
tara:strand:- start:1832 stop:2758 length:927 start_codon:yes stop_codon:yes gene_type:complete